MSEEWELFAVLISCNTNDTNFDKLHRFTLPPRPPDEENDYDDNWDMEQFTIISEYLRKHLLKVYLVKKKTILELKYDSTKNDFTGYIKTSVFEDYVTIKKFLNINIMSDETDTDKLLIEKNYKDINEILPLTIKEWSDEFIVFIKFVPYDAQTEDRYARRLFNKEAQIHEQIIYEVRKMLIDASKINKGGRKKRKTKRNKKRNRKNQKKSKRLKK